MDMIPYIIHEIIRSKNLLLFVGIIATCGPYLMGNGSLRDIPQNSSLRMMTQLPNIQSNYLLTYFAKNISQHPYFGNWTQFSFKNYDFDNREGDSKVYFYPLIRNSSMLPSKNGYQSLILKIVLNDGKYQDNIFRGNITLALPPMFNETLLSSIRSSTELKLINRNMTFLVSWEEYFFEVFNDAYDSTDVELTFIPEENLFKSGIDYASSNLFSRLNIHINNTEKGFELDITGSMHITDVDYVQILNYSILLSIVGLVQIFFSTKMLIEIDSNIQFGLNIDLMTIVIQIMCNSVICAVNFFLSITNDELNYEYGTPSLIFFCLFSIFQLRILFMAWKTRHNDLLHQDIISFRRKLFKFYSIFYCGLFLTFLSLRYWYHFFPIIYILFFFTWLFQIIYSAYHGTKPPMTFRYIFYYTLAKYFVPVYIKAYSGNIFKLKPSYGKVGLIGVTLLIEVIILSLQKIIGPKFFIPKFLKSKGFNYYKDINEIRDIQNDCVICLEKLENKPNAITVEFTSSEEGEKDNKKMTLEEILINFLHKFNQLDKKDYMVTTCSHSFHTPCLEKWLEMKNECPYCRHKIPPLEY